MEGLEGGVWHMFRALGARAGDGVCASSGAVDNQKAHKHGDSVAWEGRLRLRTAAAIKDEVEAAGL